MVVQKTVWCIFVLVLLTTENFAYEKKKCLKNGLYEHPTDCDKFYSCSPLGPVLMHCPAGLHFNPQYLVCDWPHIAGCKENRPQDAGTNLYQSCPIYPHPKDCTKYYLCLPTGPTLIPCPENLYFNPQLLVCDWPYNVECIKDKPSENIIFSDDLITMKVANTTELSPGTVLYEMTAKQTNITTIMETQTFSTSFYINETTEKITSIQSYDTSEFADKSTESYLEPICDSNIWPHPNDCTKFFMCSSTGAMEVFCPEPLHFNPVLLVCDWPHYAACKRQSNMSSEMSTTEEVSTSTLTTLGFLEIDNIFTSNNGTGDIQTTTEDSLDKTTGNILLSTDVYTEILAAEEITTNKLNDITTTFISTTNSEQCKSHIWPHPEDCAKFVMYSAIGVVEMVCPEQLQFNPILLYCDWPDNAGCKENLNVSPEKTTAEPIEDFSITTQNLGTTTIESLVKLTTENILLSTETTTVEPTSITTPSLETLADTTAESTTLLQSTESKELCKDSIWPHPDDCTKFFECGSSGAVEMFCPEQLHFNPVLLICDWPYNAGCMEYINETTELTTTELLSDDISSVPTNFSDNLTTEATTKITSDFTEPLTTMYMFSSTIGVKNSETTTVESLARTGPENLLSTTDKYSQTLGTTILASEGKTKTKGSSSIATMVMSVSESTDTLKIVAGTELCKGKIWPHPHDCTKFFVCGSTGAVEMSCPDQLYFNPAFLICDWPSNAGCSLAVKAE